MNTTVFNETPSCFGKNWDKNEAECAGGPDAGFVHPKTGLHMREQCNFFQSCGTRTQATRNAQIIPPDTLIRPQLPPAPPQAGNFTDFVRAQAVQQVEAQRLAAMTAARPPMPQTVQPSQIQYQHSPWVPQPPQLHAYPQALIQHPAPTYQLNYQMPGYLSVPEVREAGEGLLAVLFREVLRSMFKATGHSVSHFFDTRPFRQPK